MRECASFSNCRRWWRPVGKCQSMCSEGFDEDSMNSNLIDALFIFMLACFIGFEVIRHVSPLLHTPLMSLTNALDAIAVVGAIVMVGERKSTFATVLGTIAIVAATSNVVGGFFITDRMLMMFKSSRPKK